jgi:triosephosphate isomerase
MRKFLVAGNWKMNGGQAANNELLGGIISGMASMEGNVGNVEVLVCPPFPYLTAANEQISGSSVMLGSQNVSEHSSGAFTGETSPEMIKECGCQFALVGHSERRTLFGETSGQVASKFAAALAAGMTPVLCIGETLEEREAGNTESVINEQLAAVIESNGIDAFASAVVAYEPVWAIGTGMTASPEQAQDVHRHIRGVLAEQNSDVADKVQILYGGSVKGDNAAGLFGMPDIDGGLIGGASLKAADFLAIVEAAATL